MKRKNRIAVLLALVLAAGVLSAWLQLRPSIQPGVKTLSVTVEHLDGPDAVFAFATRASYLREALAPYHLLDGREDQYGLWVTAVDGEYADESQQQWWGYTINGATAQYGVDQQTVSDGDEIVFTLHVGW